VNLRDSVTNLVSSDPSRRSASLVLAPMATISHAGFRHLVHEFGGCDLYFTEMISAEALCAGTRFERYYLSLEPVPDRTIYQLVGYTADAMVAAAKRLLEHPCAGIDLNMGCSAPQIVRKGGGIAWMSREYDAARMIESLRPLLPDRSLSVKIRLAPEDDPDRLTRFTSRLAAAGLDFVTLHPKRRKDGSDRPARWAFVHQLRDAVDLPVVGNGGITDWTTYRDRTGGNGRRGGAIMIGRGAVRSPWIFAHIRAREAGTPPGEIDLFRVMERFFHLLEAHQPPEFWPSRARRVYPYVLRNVPFAHSVGARLASTREYATGKQMVLDYLRDPSRSVISIR